MHLSPLPTTITLILLATSTTTTANPHPNHIALDLPRRHAPQQPSSFTGASTLTGPAPTIETDTEPALNHAAPLAQTTPTLSTPTSQSATATSIVSGSILMEDGRPIETLIPIYTGTPPLVVTDAAGEVVGTSSSRRAEATGHSADEGGTLLDMSSSSSSSSSSGAGAVRWGRGEASVLGLVVGIVVGVLAL